MVPDAVGRSPIGTGTILVARSRNRRRRTFAHRSVRVTAGGALLAYTFRSPDWDVAGVSKRVMGGWGQLLGIGSCRSNCMFAATLTAMAVMRSVVTAAASCRTLGPT